MRMSNASSFTRGSSTSKAKSREPRKAGRFHTAERSSAANFLEPSDAPGRLSRGGDCDQPARPPGRRPRLRLRRLRHAVRLRLRRGALRGSAPEKRAALTALWREKQLQYTWLRSLQNRYADFWQVTGEALDFALETLGLAAPGLRDRLMELYLGLEPFPEVPEVLRELRGRGFRTAILSNGSPAMLETLVQRSGLGGAFDAVLSVDAVGVFKTHPKAYQFALNSLGLPAQAVSFQSSNAWDAYAASDFSDQENGLGFSDSFVQFGAFQRVMTSPKKKKVPGSPGGPRACFDRRAAGARASRAPPSARRRSRRSLGGGLAGRVRPGRTRGVFHWA